MRHFAENRNMRRIASNMLSRTRVLIRLALASTVLMLGACTVGPDYTRPSMDVGLSYKELLESGKLGEQMVGASTPAVKGWVPAQPSDAVLRGDWWQVFGDPALSDLMATLQHANLDIIQAEAQYRQAQALLQSARSGLFPTVGVSASGSRSGSGRDGSVTTGVGSDNPSNQYSVSGDVSWEPD